MASSVPERTEALRQHHGAVSSAVPFADLQRSPRLRALSHLPAAQQPGWAGHPELACIRAELADLPALVDHRHIRALRQALARVAAGAAHLLHVGECAELFTMADRQLVAQRLALYHRMARHLADRTGREVVLLTRMAGQHAKPRSEAFEELPGGAEIPVYRGDAVNSLTATADERRPDPWRMLTSYDRSRDTLEHLSNLRGGGGRAFVSHEALLRDYEEPLTRGGDVLYAASGHLVWIGERTRQLGDWHIQWASSIANPIGVKLGPSVTCYQIVDLVHALNPRQERGRLSLICRMGAAGAWDLLLPLASAVAESRTPVLWQCDPMHGNTRKLVGTKLRLLPDLRAEITAFVCALRRTGFHPGGLHLEVTPDDVRECHDELPRAASGGSWPPCDPRLNPDQAMAVVDHFAHEVGR
jgi:3-deoxy-7-phosphoheptulonate synthase